MSRNRGEAGGPGGGCTLTILVFVSRLMLCALLLTTAGLLYAHAQGWQILSVQTGSMVPTLRPGDAVVVRKMPAGKLRPGEIVSYHSQFQPGKVIDHRLIAIDPTMGWLQTRGDASRVPDQPFPPRLVIGRAVAVAPGFGRLLDWLRRPLGLLLALYLPAATIIGGEMRRLALTIASRHYRWRAVC